MKLINLNPPPGRVMIGPAASRRPTGDGFFYHFIPLTDTGFNDGGQSLSFLLETDNPDNPLIYLTYDAGLTITDAFLIDVNLWLVSYDTTVNFGGVGPTHSNVNHPNGGAGFIFFWPGMKYTQIAVDGGNTAQTYEVDGVSKSLPFSYGADGHEQKTTAAAAVTTKINGRIIINDKRLSAPIFSVTGGNITLGSTNVGPRSGYQYPFTLEMVENAPFGGTTGEVAATGFSSTFKGEIGL